MPLWRSPRQKRTKMRVSTSSGMPVPSSATVTVCLRPADVGGRPGAAVTVADEGTGIPDAVLTRIFVRFWRGDRQSGTGLGLYIVMGLVEAHGGHIEVANGEHGGAVFRFDLPAGTPEAFLED